MTTHVTKAAYGDVLAAPADKTAEVIDGVLILAPRPAQPHAVAGKNLIGTLYPTRGDGSDGDGWVVLYEPELHLGEDIVVPDLAGWRRNRYDAEAEAFFTVPPDWICEIVSPSTELRDRGQKMALYAKAGLAYAWLVQPRLRSIEAFQLDPLTHRWTVIEVYSGGSIRVPPFETLEFDLDSLWIP
jgi:Uma2 family endonuclease